MRTLKLQDFVEFLLAQNWRVTNDGGRFITYKPPQTLGLPEAYFLELPKDDSKPGWKRYADNLVEILADIYNVDQAHFKLRLAGNQEKNTG